MPENQSDRWSVSTVDVSSPEWVDHMTEDTIVSPHFDTWTRAPHTHHLSYEDDLAGITLSPVTLKSNYDPEIYEGYHSDILGAYVPYVITKPRPRRTDNKTLKRIGLVLLLLIGALLIAFGIGIMVHFLLMADNESVANTNAWYTAKVSMPVLNQTYSSDFANLTSGAFKGIAEPFCGELDLFFENSQVYSQYEGCTVKSISKNNDTDANTDCNCTGSTGVADNSIVVNFDLALSESIDHWKITDILREKTKKVKHGGFQLSLVDKFIVAVSNTPTNCPQHNTTCLNGGVCVTSPRSVTPCICPPGWTGKQCENKVTECDKSTSYCSHGQCFNTSGSLSCNCSSGWTGTTCDKDVDECSYPSPVCLNGGTCINSNGSYVCLCPSGWLGDNCQEDFDECSVSPCLHSGICTDLPGSYQCNCTSFWQGTNCERDVNECISTKPCLNGGICQNSDGSYFCRCPLGFMGQDCENDIDECDVSKPCTNGATCVNYAGFYRCSCAAGYTGTHCENDIDECVTRPCQNGATCVNGVAAYKCVCPGDYTGQECQTLITTIFSYATPVLNLTFGPNLDDQSSALYKQLAGSFVSDVESIILKNTTAFPAYLQVVVKDFSTTSKTLEWELHFKGDETPTTRTSVKDFIINSKTPQVLGDYLGVKIGDLLLFLDTYNSTNIFLNLKLLNFTYTPGLSDTSSGLFQLYQASVCNDIGLVLKYYQKRFPNYKDCRMTSMTDNPPNAVIDLFFEADYPESTLRDEILYTFSTSLPSVPFREKLGYKLGEFLVFDKYRTDITTVPLSFRVLNLTWTPELSQNDSVLFQTYSNPFCADIDRILRSSYLTSSYDFCAVDSFGSNPLSITAEVQLTGNHSLDEVSRNISQLIFDNTPEERYNGNIGHVVGSLLVYRHDWDITKHDAWMSNTTFFIYDFKFKPAHLDPNSSEFNTFQTKFCGDIDRFFTNSTLSQRYYRCFVEKIGDSKPHTMNFNLVFNGTDAITDNVLIDIINSSARNVFVENTNMMYIGQQVYYLSGFSDNTAVNISDYTTTTYIPPTQSPVDIFINVTLVVLNLNFTKDLEDQSSQMFRNLSEPFCGFLSGLYVDRFPKQKYKGCDVKTFLTEPTDLINFMLYFEGELDKSLRNSVYSAVIENAPREKVKGYIAIMIGPLAIYERSLGVDQTNV